MISITLKNHETSFARPLKFSHWFEASKAFEVYKAGSIWPNGFQWWPDNENLSRARKDAIESIDVDAIISSI